ncbi:MAG: uL15 family ribosomal protein, partial [bacterium]|nr:uL15 family ribosomal protein [bacterium]
FQVVSLHAIEKVFKANEIVSVSSLLEKGVISRFGGKLVPVKILAAGEMTKVLAFEGCKVSKNAKASIEKAGGTVKA